METPDLNLIYISETPLYQQVSTQVANQIYAKKLRAGSLLPSIREMAATQNISVITVQKAYDELTRKGLIVAHRGKGFVVAEIAFKELSQMAIEEFRDLITKAAIKGLNQGLSISEMKKVAAEVIGSAGVKNEK